MAELSPELSHQFEDLEQQRETAILGMWSFLMTEVLFFSGMFLLYTIYRVEYPQAWAECSRVLDAKLGAISAAVLLTSSLTMNFAVLEAQAGRKNGILRWLFVTQFLGATFLCIEGYEWYLAFREHHFPGINFQFEGSDPHASQMFYSLYFTMTGVHALHMIIGLCLLGVIAFMAERGRFTSTYSNPVMITGLYWHLVDIVWIFLFPTLYLVGSR